MFGATHLARYTVLVNNESFNIGTNLDTALRYLRHEDESKTLWVDAVCIDQQSVLERNQQVNRMVDV